MIELENGNLPAFKNTLKRTQKLINPNVVVNTLVLGHERLNYLNMKVGSFG